MTTPTSPLSTDPPATNPVSANPVDANPVGANPFSTVAILTVLVALGVLLGIYSALLSADGPRSAGRVFTWGIGIAVVGNIGAGVLGRIAGGRLGGAAPLVGWLLAVYILSISRPNGSAILAGGDFAVPSILVQTLGAVAGALAAVLKPPKRWRVAR